MSILTKLVLTIASATIINPIAADPDVRFGYDGQIVGLADPKQHEVIPQNYSRIDYIGHGLYLAWGLNADNPLEYGAARTVFNKDGKMLATKVPPDCVLKQVCWLGAAADQNPEATLQELPNDTILRFTKNGKFGLCDLQGQIILEPKYNKIFSAHEGKCFVTEYPDQEIANSKLYLFDCAKKTLKEWPYKGVTYADQLEVADELVSLPGTLIAREGVGYGDLNGNFVLLPIYQAAGPFQKNMATVRYKNPDTLEICSRVINKQGKFVSPENLDVEQFYGDFAIAKVKTEEKPKFGLVNRRMRFVIAPRYDRLSPVFDNATLWASRLAMTEKFLHNAPLYHGEEGTKQVLLTPGDHVVFKAPAHFYITAVDGDEVCCINPQNKIEGLPGQKRLKFDSPALSGLDSDDLRRKNPGLRPVGPDRFLTHHSADNGKFSLTYWRSGSECPVSRIEMFSRFLKEYDLIGMPRDKLLSLLVPDYLAAEKTDTYKIFMTRGCTQQGTLIINLEKDKVVSFTALDWEQLQKPMTVTTNSLLVFDTPPEPNYQLPRFKFVPKAQKPQ